MFLSQYDTNMFLCNKHSYTALQMCQNATYKMSQGGQKVKEKNLFSFPGVVRARNLLFSWINATSYVIMVICGAL